MKFPTTLILLAGLLLAGPVLAATARAPLREYDVLREFAARFAELSSSDMPDAKGLTGTNRKHGSWLVFRVTLFQELFIVMFSTSHHGIHGAAVRSVRFRGTLNARTVIITTSVRTTTADGHRPSGVFHAAHGLVDGRKRAVRPASRRAGSRWRSERTPGPGRGRCGCV